MCLARNSLYVQRSQLVDFWLKNMPQVTSKIWASKLHDVESALDESLANLCLDYLDCEWHTQARCVSPVSSHTSREWDAVLGPGDP